MVKVKPVDYVASKWKSRAQSAVEDYKRFVQSPSRDPIAAAISMKETLVAKMRSDETWRKWEEKLSAVGFKGWLEAVLTKGVQRYPQGIEFGSKYYEQFYSEFSKHLEAGLEQIYRMPRVTLEDSINRAAAMIRHNAKFRFIKKS